MTTVGIDRRICKKGNYMHNRVFVLDSDRKPLAPCHPARARELLRKQKAAVFRKYPFTIILKKVFREEDIVIDNLEVKLDPGAKTTGLAIVIHGLKRTKVIFGLNIVHRAKEIVANLLARRQLRRARRQRKTRYRAPRFDNRTRPIGWLAPSIRSIVENIRTWLIRLIKYCGISKCQYEDVKFDTQKMMNPDIVSREYQQGTLFNFEVKEFLLTTYKHTCQYCKGLSKDPILEIEHIIPKSKGGTNTISNLTLSCSTCNRMKGSKSIDEWKEILLMSSNIRNKERIKNIDLIRKRKIYNLKSTAHVSSIRNALPMLLDYLGIEHSKSFGYITKYNRSKLKYRKDHWIDAAMVGADGINVKLKRFMKCLTSTSRACNNRQMQLMDKYGFPRTSAKINSNVFGFKSGDITRAVVTTGKYIGKYVGTIAVRKSGVFDLNKISISHKNLTILHKGDGYKYHHGTFVYKKLIMSAGFNIKKYFKTRYRIVGVDNTSRLDCVTVVYNT